MADREPWVSVLLPTYNGERYLPAALESLAAQEGDCPLEVIVVDDGSTDRTLEILESFRARLAVTVLWREHCGNWVRRVNEALRQAQGEWVSILHQDDLWHPRRLAELQSAARAVPEAAWWLHPSTFIDACGRRVGSWRLPLGRNTNAQASEMEAVHRATGGLVAKKEILQRLLVQNYIAAPAPLVSLRAAKEAGPLDETLWYLADWDWWLRLAGSQRAGVLPTELASFRLHSGSQTSFGQCRFDDMRRQFDLVLARHLDPWVAAHPSERVVARAASFSAEANVWLAARAAGAKPAAWPMVKRAASLGPVGWWRYLHDSRIVERIRGRQRAGLRR